VTDWFSTKYEVAWQWGTKFHEKKAFAITYCEYFRLSEVQNQPPRRKSPDKTQISEAVKADYVIFAPSKRAGLTPE